MIDCMQTMIAESTFPLPSLTQITPDSTPCLAIKRTDISSAQQITALFPLTSLALSHTCHAPASSRLVRSTPLFNGDGLHFTPAFMLEEDQLRLHRNPENLKLFCKLHEGKLQQCRISQNNQEEDIMIPRPTSNLFCHVCKCAYEDYLTHTTSPAHTTKVVQNKFWTDISKLCARFAPSSSKGKISRRKPIKKMDATCKRNKNKVGEELPQCESVTSVDSRP